MGSHVIIADNNLAAAEQLKARLINEGHTEHRLSVEQVDATEPDSVAELAVRLTKKQGYLNHLISVIGGAAPADAVSPRSILWNDPEAPTPLINTPGVEGHPATALSDPDTLYLGTDRGVHAWGQVASLSTGRDLTAGKLLRALGAKLPADVPLQIADLGDLHPNPFVLHPLSSLEYIVD